MIVAGTVTLKMAPVLKRIWDQMPDPKWCISMGACSSVGGPFNTYAVLQGVDKIVPVDVYVIGCPPRPENLFYALLKLQDKIDQMTRWSSGPPKCACARKWWSSSSATSWWRRHPRRVRGRKSLQWVKVRRRDGCTCSPRMRATTRRSENMAFLRAARKDEIPAGSIREFQVDGKTLAIANVDGKFYAIDNTCLHRGGPLAPGPAQRQDRHLPVARLAVRRHLRKGHTESGRRRGLLHAGSARRRHLGGLRLAHCSVCIPLNYKVLIPESYFAFCGI